MYSVVLVYGIFAFLNYTPWCKQVLACCLIKTNEFPRPKAIILTRNINSIRVFRVDDFKFWKWIFRLCRTSFQPHHWYLVQQRRGRNGSLWTVLTAFRLHVICSRKQMNKILYFASIPARGIYSLTNSELQLWELIVKPSLLADRMHFFSLFYLQMYYI